MSGDNALRPFMSKLAPPTTIASAGIETESDLADDLGAFGWLRGVRERALMLELRMRDGRIVAQGYAWLERVEFDPADGITLTFTGRTIRIVGKRLNAEVRPLVRLFDGLLRHRVPWVTEAGRSSALGAEAQEVVVERIECE
jgi:hypothetical protein